MALGVPASELRARLTGYELAEWAAFERLYGPILVQERVDIAGAFVSATMASVFGRKQHAPTEFMPKWDQPRDSEETLLAKARSIFLPKRRKGS